MCKKLQKLKIPLKKLNEEHFSHISARAERAAQDLRDVQARLQVQPQNVSSQTEAAVLRKKAMSLKEAERLFFLQPAKCKYLKQSDRCSKFFHSMVIRNSKGNHIAAAVKEDGALSTSFSQVVKEFSRLYGGLLGTEAVCEPIDQSVMCMGTQISIDQAGSLTVPISDKEIKDALHDIGDDKAPGPDGFSACFFKKAWHIVGVQL